MRTLTRRIYFIARRRRTFIRHELTTLNSSSYYSITLLTQKTTFVEWLSIVCMVNREILSLVFGFRFFWGPPKMHNLWKCKNLWKFRWGKTEQNLKIEWRDEVFLMLLYLTYQVFFLLLSIVGTKSLKLSYPTVYLSRFSLILIY